MADPAARKVIVVVGMPGSGKGTFSDLAKEAGWTVIAFRDVALDAAKKHGKTNDHGVMRQVADDLRKKLGPDWTALEIVKKAKTVKGNLCIDDMRTPEELTVLRREFPGMRIIALISDKDERYQRLLVRKRWDDHSSRDIFEKNETTGGAWGIPDVVAKADIMIDNDSTLEEFKDKCREVLSEFA